MNLPQDFSRNMELLLGREAFLRLAEALDEPARVAFRPNGGKGFRVAGTLSAVPWSSSGFYLNDRPAFTFDPLFHQGAYYVQEPSSMFVEQALRVCGSPRKVLDLCAAPGGKSTLIRSCLPPESLLVSNEPVKLRAQVLVENMLKWGHPATVVTNNYPADFGGALPGYFDVIAVDAPCSGEGMFRKDNPALEEWSTDNVMACASRQRSIVKDVWPALAEGGFLIYSTCTYNVEENERNVMWICRELGAELVKLPVDAAWNIAGSLCSELSGPVYRFLPHLTEGEGFFLALLRKTVPVSQGNRRTKPVVLPKLKEPALSWLASRPEGWRLWQSGDQQWAIDGALAASVGQLLSALKVLSAGVELATLKGRKLQPLQGLALSHCCCADAFPRVAVEGEEALAYLRRQSLTLPPSTPRGYVLLTWQGQPLGFVNNLGAHANNLYPQNWKIRSGYTTVIDNKFVERIG